MLIKGQAMLFLIGTLAVGPGLFVNTLLKDHSAQRAQPSTFRSSAASLTLPRHQVRQRGCQTVARSSPASRRVHSGPWRRPRSHRRNRAPSAAPTALARLRQRRVGLLRPWCRRRRALFHRRRVRRPVHVSGDLGIVADAPLCSVRDPQAAPTSRRIIYSGAPRN